MRNYHGIIFAYQTTPELRELVSARSGASLPFCGRYRLIDFPLSSLRNAGILDCGVIMQRNYQSLLDHLSSGKAWDMSRAGDGGLRKQECSMMDGGTPPSPQWRSCPRSPTTARSS